MRYASPAVLFFAALVITVAAQSADKESSPQDWSTYNYDITGTRYNASERTLGPGNVGRLVEKWRFPPADALEPIGAVNATPMVVDGYVYFGTTSTEGLPPTFFKLTPNGKVRWSYQNPAFKRRGEANLPVHSVPGGGFLNAALVTADTVYVGDAGGFIYALDRTTGQERWKINSRQPPFPGAHSSNCIYSAPVLADGKIVVAGGGFEHAVATNLEKPCCTGRGFVVALEPQSGAVLWKYDVGPEPQRLEPPVKITDDWGEHVYHFGPSTSSVWCTPSYDAASHLIYFGTDTHNAPRQPTEKDPRLYTEHSCAVIAVDARTGKEQWVTQINPDDVWNYSMRGYNSKTGRYKDQSIGDTPKIYTVEHHGRATKVVGFGCKNGGFYVVDAATGEMLHHTPLYTGPPATKPAQLDPRTLALPSVIGGLQTGCATDGKAVYTNGLDMPNLFLDPRRPSTPPTGGRVVSISLDTQQENWRHERPLVAEVKRSDGKPPFKSVGDPVASGIAIANGVAYFTTVVSGKLVALDTATGKVLKEIPLGPVWCGPSVSRGRVYVGSGNQFFSPGNPDEDFFPKRQTGTVYCFGLPGDDEVSQLGEGDEGSADP